MDSSAVAVDMTRRRGGTAIHRDLFSPLPGEGSWQHVLLIDGNIGIGGNPIRTLRRAAELLAHGGTVIVELDTPAITLCHEMLRWETEQHLGQWFPWSRVGIRALGAIAQSAGLLVSHVVEIHERVIAVLTVAACAT